MIPAAKIHMLGISPIKDRLGPKWNRLSTLVHSLFEKAISREIGPSDHFIVLDELSYAVTFHDLSVEEANLACLKIGKNVCQALFGELDSETHIRNLVCEFSGAPCNDLTLLGKAIELEAERSGLQSIVVASNASGNPKEPIAAPQDAASSVLKQNTIIQSSHDLLKGFGIKLGFFPTWDLQSNQSNAVVHLPFRGPEHSPTYKGRKVLDALDAASILKIEIALLRSASAYAEKLYIANKVASVGVGVSFATLASPKLRDEYFTALKNNKTFLTSPTWIRLEQIPVGVPLARIAKKISLLKAHKVHVVAEFQQIGNLPKIDIHLGAARIGGTAPNGIDPDTASRIFEKVAKTAAAQKSFGFVENLSSKKLIDVARSAGIRFGKGSAFNVPRLTGLEPIPNFPLAYHE
jgi:hypothetical protein